MMKPLPKRLRELAEALSEWDHPITAKSVCMAAANEIEQLTSTNQRLNRRAQESESAIHQNNQYRWGYSDGVASLHDRIEYEKKIANHRASHLGQVNAKLKREIAELKSNETLKPGNTEIIE